MPTFVEITFVELDREEAMKIVEQYNKVNKVCFDFAALISLFFRLQRRKGLERSMRSERTRSSVAVMELDQGATSGALGELQALSRKFLSIILNLLAMR